MTLRPRFQNTGKGSFFGNFVYERIVPKDHFLVALENLFDWGAISQKLIGAYRGRGIHGRPPYDPAQIFKMLFISYLYGVSEREVEQLVSYHLVVKWFIGLAVDEPAPDHSTLTVFKNRFLRGDTWEKLVACFDDLLQQARGQGLEIGHIQILDSVHTQADVNVGKESKRQDQGQPPRDPDARVVHKGKREVVEPDGRRTKKEIRYKGYKLIVLRTRPMSRSTRRPAWSPASFPPGETGPIQTLICTCNKAFPDLLTHDRTLQLPTTTYGGDRAYDDTDIYERLEAAGLHPGICLRRFRTEKKDANRERWIVLKATPEYQEATAQRYRVEQAFGPAKQKHGFERCRYIGLLRYRIQSLFTFLVRNFKRMVKLLTGLTFRPQAKGRLAETVRPVYACLPWA